MWYVIYDIPHGTLKGHTIVVPNETFKQARDYVYMAAAKVGVGSVLAALKGNYYASQMAKHIANELDRFHNDITATTMDVGDNNIYRISEELPDHNYLLLVVVDKKEEALSYGD